MLKAAASNPGTGCARADAPDMVAAEGTDQYPPTAERDRRCNGKCAKNRRYLNPSQGVYDVADASVL